MTKRASDELIEAFNQRKGDRNFTTLGHEIMVSPMLLERFAQGLQIQDETTYHKIVAWVEGKNPQPPVG